jgi:YD repeat-containing protein
VSDTLEAPARLNSGRELSYAHGLIVREAAGERIVSHSGGAAGYSTWLGRFIENELSVVVLGNYEPLSAGDLAVEVAELFLPPVDLETGPEGPTAVPGIRVEGRDGLYLEAGGGDLLQLAIQGGRLAIVGGPELVPVGEDRFQPRRSMLFFRSEDSFELRFESEDELTVTSMEGDTTRYLRADPWEPTEADLRATEGRYGCDELGRVIEITTDDGVLAFRLEDAPMEAIETTPVAPDIFMRGRVSVRFVRDDEGSITGFDYANPVVRRLRYERLGDLDGTDSDEPPPEREDR